MAGIRRTLDFEEPEVDAIHRELVDAGWIAPVVLDDGADEGRWVDCELASYAENRIGDGAHPFAIDEARRELWRQRATEEAIWPPSRRRGLEACYWLLDRGVTVGTIALARTMLGSTLMRVSSLYVLPEHRGRAIARTTLVRLRDAFGKHGLGLKLTTNWTWQRPLGLYVRMGMWVHSWKRDVALRFEMGVPAPVVEVDERRVSLSVVIGERRLVLAEAEREGERLVLADQPTTPEGAGDEIQALAWDARSTLALALALRGWPLVRSSEDWERSRYSDFGPPEALAYKITIWEAWDRKHGWRVDTPRIAGLAYPTWDELEARWKAAASSSSDG